MSSGKIKKIKNIHGIPLTYAEYRDMIYLKGVDNLLHKSELKPGRIYEISLDSGEICRGVFCNKEGWFNPQYSFNINQQIYTMSDHQFAVNRLFNLYND